MALGVEESNISGDFDQCGTDTVKKYLQLSVLQADNAEMILHGSSKCLGIGIHAPLCNQLKHTLVFASLTHVALSSLLLPVPRDHF